MFFVRRKALPRGRESPVRKRIFFILLAVFALVTAALLIVDLRIKPIIRTQAENEVHRLCMSAVNKAAGDAVAECADYGDVIKIERDRDGAVTSVTSDVSKLNSLKTEVNEKILQSLHEVESAGVNVPLGTLTGSTLMLGRGPKVNVKLNLNGSCDVQIKSEFQSTGINQTRYIVSMEVVSRVDVMMLDGETVGNYSVNVPLAEAVIVGDVPDTYLNIE